MIDTNSPISILSGVGPSVAKKCERLNIYTLGELLEWIPRRYEDWSKLRSIKSLKIGEKAVIEAKLVWVKNEKTSRRRFTITKALLRDQTGEMLAIWFNQPFLANNLVSGRTSYWLGAVGYDNKAGLKQLSNPQSEQRAIIQPIYRETAGLSTKMLRRMIAQTFGLIKETDDYLPPEIIKENNFPSRYHCLKTLHQPRSNIEVSKARGQLAFEELFIYSYQLLAGRKLLTTCPSPQLRVEDDVLKSFTSSLSYELTNSQRKAAWQIIQDLAGNKSMQRLLEGDVGSGKTVVGAFASFVAAKCGYQSVWLAPTEVLATQHYTTLKQLLASHNIEVGLWTSHRREVISEKPQVIVGTHALLFEGAPLGKAGFIVIDEQHRFGVEQRTFLRKLIENSHGLSPHFLSMTATPIPRSLALALYGDLEVSMLEERPKNRRPITTRLISPDGRPHAYEFIRQQVSAGRQVFVVCPLIEENETSGDSLFDDLEQKSVLKEYDRLKKEVFPELVIGLLHGKLKPSEKQKVMQDFSDGKIDILVSTTVIEVGIDVPNASVIVIESADRFGLAQLHQLRGRVGRGQYNSYCFLFSETDNAKAITRLRALETIDSGFELAELDLSQRGPGELLGEMQSGFHKFRYADLFDTDLITSARQAAQRTIDNNWTSAGLEKQISNSIKNITLD